MVECSGYQGKPSKPCRLSKVFVSLKQGLVVDEERGYSVQEPKELLKLKMGDDPQLIHIGHACPGISRRIFPNKV